MLFVSWIAHRIRLGFLRERIWVLFMIDKIAILENQNGYTEKYSGINRMLQRIMKRTKSNVEERKIKIMNDIFRRVSKIDPSADISEIVKKYEDLMIQRMNTLKGIKDKVLGTNPIDLKKVKRVNELKHIYTKMNLNRAANKAAIKNIEETSKKQNLLDRSKWIDLIGKDPEGIKNVKQMIAERKAVTDNALSYHKDLLKRKYYKK
jgi:hypothetical protein